MAYTCYVLAAVLSTLYSLAHTILPETYDVCMKIIFLFIGKEIDAKKLRTGLRSHD